MSLDFPFNTEEDVDFGDVNDTSTEMTFDFWFYSTQAGSGTGSTRDAIASKEADSGDTSAGWAVDVNQNDRKLAIRIEGTTLISTSALPLNEWVHIAVVVESTAITCYRNGESDGTIAKASTDTPGPNANTLAFGARSASSTDTPGGRLAEVRIWDRALSQSEIKAIMHRRIGVGEFPNLLGYWPCDEGSGTTVYDRRQLNNGTHSGPVPYSSESPPIQQIFPS